MQIYISINYWLFDASAKICQQIASCVRRESIIKYCVTVEFNGDH